MTTYSNKEIGSTGIAVPPVCFGTSALGNMPDTYGYSVDEALALDTIRAIFASPMAFLDASRNYGFGRSEERVGKIIPRIRRASRGFLWFPPNLTAIWIRENSMPPRPAAHLSKVLRRWVWIVCIFCIFMIPNMRLLLTRLPALGGALDELFKIKEEGLADAVGLAAGKVDIMMPLLRDWDFDVLITHNRFTLL